MSTGKDGSVNIWNTRLKMHSVASFNVKSRYEWKEESQRKEIEEIIKFKKNNYEYIQRKYKKGEDEGKVTVLMKNQSKAPHSKEE